MSTPLAGHSIWATGDRIITSRYYVISSFDVAMTFFSSGGQDAPYTYRFSVLSPCCQHDYNAHPPGDFWTCMACDSLNAPQLDLTGHRGVAHGTLDLSTPTVSPDTRSTLEAMAGLKMDPLTALLAVETFEQVALDFVKSNPWGENTLTGALALA